MKACRLQYIAQMIIRRTGPGASAASAIDLGRTANDVEGDSAHLDVEQEADNMSYAYFIESLRHGPFDGTLCMAVNGERQIIF